MKCPLTQSRKIKRKLKISKNIVKYQKKKNYNHPRAINWENLYMYFEGKIIAFIIAEGRGETERKTRRDQEKKDRSASFSAGHHRARERRELA